MSEVNGKRMYTGADMRLYGVQLNKIEPCNIILFTTAVDKKGALRPEEFLNMKPDNQNLFKEIFRWDQKLNIVNFRADGKNRFGIFDEIVERYGGSKLDYAYQTKLDVEQAKPADNLKHFINTLAS